MKELKNVVIIGIGALGAIYAKQIVKNGNGINLYCVVKDREKYINNPLYINGELLPVQYYTYELPEIVSADIIILTVKSYNIKNVIDSMKPLIGKNTIILSFLNGVLSEEQLSDEFGQEHVVYSTIVQADTYCENNQVNCKNFGKVIFGEKNALITKKINRISKFFDICKIPYEIVNDVQKHLWNKLLVNVGCNQVSTLYQMTYNSLRNSKKALNLMRVLQREVIELANKQEILLTEDDIYQWEQVLKTLSSDGRSSMLQDFWMNKKLETDILGDYICEMGEKLGVHVFTNCWVNQEIKKLTIERNKKNIDTEKKIKICKKIKKEIACITQETVANELRREIIGQEFSQGEKLAENPLAKRFQTNRNVIRGALQILSNEGLVITHNNGRREVVEFAEQQIKDLYDFRWMIENKALQLIMKENRSKNSMYPMLASILFKIATLDVDKIEDTNWYELDVQFHRELVHAADNLFLSNAWESNANIIYALMSFNSSSGYKERYAREFYEKHRAIYELLLSGNIAACEEELKKHVIDAEEIAYSGVHLLNFKKNK